MPHPEAGPATRRAHPASAASSIAIGGALLIAGAVLGGLAIVLDLGRTWWLVGVAVAGCGLAAAGLVTARLVPATRSARVAAVIVAAAVVAGGIMAALPHRAGWSPPHDAGAYVGTADGTAVTSRSRSVAGWEDGDGSPSWTWRAPGLVDSVVVVTDTVVVEAANQLTGLDRRTGDKRWQQPVEDGVDPVDAYGDILVMSTRADGRAFAIEVGSGELQWDIKGHAGVSSQVEDLGSTLREYGSPYVVVRNGLAAKRRLRVVDVRTGRVERTVRDASDFVLTSTSLLTRRVVLRGNPRRYRPGPWVGYSLTTDTPPWSASLRAPGPWTTSSTGDGPDSVIDSLQPVDLRWLTLDPTSGHVQPLTPPGRWRVTGAPRQFAFDVREPGMLLVSAADERGVWVVGGEQVTRLPAYNRRLASFASPKAFAEVVETTDAFGDAVTRIDLVRDGRVRSVDVELSATDHLDLAIVGDVVVVQRQRHTELVVPLSAFGG